MFHVFDTVSHAETRTREHASSASSQVGKSTPAVLIPDGPSTPNCARAGRKSAGTGPKTGQYSRKRRLAATRTFVGRPRHQWALRYRDVRAQVHVLDGV